MGRTFRVETDCHRKEESMGEPGDGKIKVSELYQAAVVVHDLERSIERYRSTLGIGPWETVDVDSADLAEATYRGRPAHYKFRAALAMVGPMQLELIQHVEGDSIFRDFIEEHGEGLHHLGHIRVSDLPGTIRRMEEEGIPCLQSGSIPGAGYAYMDTVKELGAIVELLELPEDLPAPGRH
jgi:hypothetical protein